MKDPRDKIFNSYYTTIKESFQENCSQIKLINYGTGSGKTHMLFQALYEAIKQYQNFQIIGIYVAPLREHLQIPSKLKEQYKDIPVYKIHSLEMKMTEEYMKLYKKWIPLILNNKKFWNSDLKKYSSDKIQENQHALKRVEKLITQIEYLKKIDFGNDDANQNMIKKAMRDIDKLLGNFLYCLINYTSDETSWPDECLKLAEIFYPLYLLRKTSGILMLTCKKFETTVPYFKFNSKTWVKKEIHLYKYVNQQTNDSLKFILAFDEQEDGYNIMLREMIDIISPQTLAINNALSSINRELSVLFSRNGEKNRKLFKFLEENPGAFYEFDEFIEKNRVVEPRFKELAQIYQRLIIEEGNSPNFLKKIAKINTSLERSLEKIANVFEEFHEEKPVPFDFKGLYKILSKFENNRSLLIPYSIYAKIGNDLTNIFSFNNIYIYNIEPLKKLFLTRCSSGHVNITEEEIINSPSLAELIYVILTVRLQLKTIKDFLINVLNAEDSQSRSLEIWSKQVSKVQTANEEEIKIKSNYLDQAYVYDSYKSIINIMEISRYQHKNAINSLVNHNLREVSIGSTAILTSPEKTINSIITKGTNIIFFISATGGISGDLTTSYDMHYLEDSLRDKESGESSFKIMTEQEVMLCEEIRRERQQKRQISVNFFNEDIASCPNICTQKPIEYIENILLKDFITSLTDEGRWFGSYKIKELKNFIRFLLHLFEDDSIQEIFALTQTIQWIRKFILFCEKSKNNKFIFQESSEHPDIYYIQVNHKTYQSHLKIKLIFYSASFNSRYHAKKFQKKYEDELQEEDAQKIFFISAYQSASKGLNPIVKTKNGEEKDFDSLVLLMDAYYSIMQPPARSSKQEKLHENDKHAAIYHFALMKHIVASGEFFEIKKFNEYLNKPEAKAFRKRQHQILLGKGILQSIGRTERRDFSGQLIKIFINEESRKKLVDFYQYLSDNEPNEIRKLSVNNYEVYVRTQEEERKHAIADHDEHVDREIEASLAIQAFREIMLSEIEKFHHRQHSFDVATAWEALRNPLVFKDPESYLNELSKTGLFPEDFIKALFYCPQEKAFTPYLVDVNEGKFLIISDSIHGKNCYSYQQRLYPEYLERRAKKFYPKNPEEADMLNPSAEKIYRLYKQLIPQPEIFQHFIPRPHYFYDVLYPSLAEHFVECWIKNVIFSGEKKDWKKIKSMYGFDRLSDFNKYNTLYERFDLFYMKDNELFCIDVKAWSRASGNRLSKDVLEKTQKKLDAIVAEYSEFNKVKGLLLNLHAEHEKTLKHSGNLFSGNLIFFDQEYVPIESEILRNFLFSKEI